MNKQPRMTNEEAIEVIKKNFPPENYTMLREALNIAIESLGKVDPIPLPTIKPGDRVNHSSPQFPYQLNNVKVDHLRVHTFGTYASLEFEGELYTVPLDSLELIS